MPSLAEFGEGQVWRLVRLNRESFYKIVNMETKLPLCPVCERPDTMRPYLEKAEFGDD